MQNDQTCAVAKHGVYSVNPKGVGHADSCAYVALKAEPAL